MTVNLRQDFSKAWQGKDPFSEVNALEGEIFRDVAGRRTLRFEFEGNRYFAKIHQGVGWQEIFKNFLVGKMPILGAENEWCAVAKLRECDIDTMTTVGFGSRGWNPAKRESFILTEALEETVSLEDYCADWIQHPPSVQIKRQLIEQLATISRKMHGNGVCHRDYYICHFLLHDVEAFTNGEHTTPKLSLIDLHRALNRRNLSQRWIVKDVAGLYFSALHIGLTQRDFLRFLRVYAGKPLRSALKEDGDFWQKVNHRALQMDKKHNQS
ncbi:MAG: lipopolysaccharide core heptose(I) kinase RfaP [Gammaproteobacteria bacterium]